MNKSVLLSLLLGVFSVGMSAQNYTVEGVVFGEQVAKLYTPGVSGVQSGIGIVVLHAEQNYQDFIACKELAERGFHVIGSGPVGVTLEEKVLCVKNCVDYIRNLPDVGKVVLLGHSGGATLMTAYQVFAENGTDYTKGMIFSDYTDALNHLYKADGMLLLDANWGMSTVILNSIDANVIDEATGERQEPLVPETEELAYMKLQEQRYSRIVGKARHRLAELGGRDEPLVIPGSASIRFYNKLYSGNVNLLSHTKGAWSLIHGDGTITVGQVRTVRAPLKTRTELSPASNTTVRGFLSFKAIGTTADYRVTEDGMEGIDWTSNLSTPIGNVRGISVPLLAVGMTGSWEYLASESIWRMSASADKKLAFVQGAGHMFAADRQAEEYNGTVYGNTVKALFDYVASWLTAPGRFMERDADPLSFDPGRYEIHRKSVPTSRGPVEVEYRAYLHIPYVSRPVDPDYQSLNIYVPVSIDGERVDASHAPVILANGIGGYMPVNNSEREDIQGRKEELALAAGMVVVDPGARGRTNRFDDGTWYGKAPAGLVDLKAAVRWLRYNAESVPGDEERIVSLGCSAGGNMSALVGATGNAVEYERYLTEIGATEGRDDVFAAAVHSPITDLGHADMAYEWEFGRIPHRGRLVDQELSAKLKAEFAGYEKSLGLKGRDGFGKLTADNLGEYIAGRFLNPSATTYVLSLKEAERDEYLSERGWLHWDGASTHMTMEDYNRYMSGRYKGLPSYDAFDLSTPENSLFGDSQNDAGHWTDFSLRYASGNPKAKISRETKRRVELMDPLSFVLKGNKGCAPHWRIRHGTTESGVSRAAMTNLTTALENGGYDVDAALYWEAMHCVDKDPEGFVTWVQSICR